MSDHFLLEVTGSRGLTLSASCELSTIPQYCIDFGIIGLFGLFITLLLEFKSKHKGDPEEVSLVLDIQGVTREIFRESFKTFYGNGGHSKSRRILDDYASKALKGLNR